ncbi:MAG: peptidoglycan DD-metalloendopeptidase family protein [Muribaculaceae bacterium]|nr:peptidoglycan DD-metalloendopeptidase family protein [Muribaculaceae bacterium]
MKGIKIILIILALILAGTSATRADEMSELVAAVAASIQKEHVANDFVTGFSDDAKPRYKAKAKEPDLDLALLDGIISSVKRENFRKMRREIYDEEEDYLSLIKESFLYPTLGRADFFRPVPGIITSHFGWRPRFHRMHHGVDLSLHVGDTVRAAISGTVERISYDADGYGHYVVVSHPDSMQTVYGHLSHALVTQGQFVYAGQPLAIGGNTGNSTGPHLHFETRMGGVAVDPTLLFDFYGNYRYYADASDEMPVSHTPTYSHQSKSLKKAATYIVRYGDTLESVARQAGLSVTRLCQLNMLDSSGPLPVGRMLKLK